MKRTVLSIALAVATLAGAAQPLQAQERSTTGTAATAVATLDPAQQVHEWVRLFRADDLAGLVQTLLPPDKLQEARLAYELGRLHPISDEDRAQFDAEFAKISGPNAVEELMAKIEPELEKARPQIGGALLMGFGAMHMAVASPDSDLSDAQRAALEGALPGIQQWATSHDFLSSESMREALTLLTDAVRQTGISDLDQARQLSFDDVLSRADVVLAAAKDALRIYGLDADAIADSLQVEVLEREGDTARVRASVILFGAPIWSEHELVLQDGRWYGKKAASTWAFAGKPKSKG